MDVHTGEEAPLAPDTDGYQHHVSRTWFSLPEKDAQGPVANVCMWIFTT